jgi:hypothetical protein
MNKLPEKAEEANEAEEKLKAAIDLGRCRICEGMIVEGYPESCTCCPNCGNINTGCLCCNDCLDDPSTCRCYARIEKIWKGYINCIWCTADSELDECVIHQDGQRCPLCCPYCKEFTPNCRCCKKCFAAPCICCTRCNEVRINCKCKFVRVLSHFIRRAAVYHKLRESYFPANTAALITIPNED